MQAPTEIQDSSLEENALVFLCILVTIFVMNPCKQEKRALERKLSEMEEEMKVGNNLFTLLVLGFMLCINVFWDCHPGVDAKGVLGKGLVSPLSVFLCAVRASFNGQT